jgi:hypothetical protein
VQSTYNNNQYLIYVTLQKFIALYLVSNFTFKKSRESIKSSIKNQIAFSSKSFRTILGKGGQTLIWIPEFQLSYSRKIREIKG